MMFYNLPRTADELPEELPIFPLAGSVLLPRCRLPLNIFEPRYLHMVFDALKTDRLIGLIQPMPLESAASPGELYRIGGAGRITSFEETDDGRVLLQLTGLARFAVAHEVDGVHGYRKIRPDWLPFATDLIAMQDATIAGGDVLKILTPFFEAHHLRAEWHALERIAGSELIDVLAMNLPFPPEDKQALLEAADTQARFEVLRKIAAMAGAAGVSAGNETRH